MVFLMKSALEKKHLDSYISHCKSELEGLLKGIYVNELSATITGLWFRVSGHFTLELRDGTLLDNYVSWTGKRITSFAIMLGTVPLRGRSTSLSGKTVISIRRSLFSRKPKISIEPWRNRRNTLVNRLVNELYRTMAKNISRVFMEDKYKVGFINIVIDKTSPEELNIVLASLFDKTPLSIDIVKILQELKRLMETHFLHKIEQKKPEQYTQYIKINNY